MSAVVLFAQCVAEIAESVLFAQGVAERAEAVLYASSEAERAEAVLFEQGVRKANSEALGVQLTMYQFDDLLLQMDDLLWIIRGLSVEI